MPESTSTPPSSDEIPVPIIPLPVEVDGTRLSYLPLPNGEVIVIDYGYAGSHGDWNPVGWAVAVQDSHNDVILETSVDQLKSQLVAMRVAAALWHARVSAPSPSPTPNWQSLHPTLCAACDELMLDVTPTSRPIHADCRSFFEEESE
jgi:hypothetical protein